MSPYQDFTLLIIDDEPEVAKSLRRQFRRKYTVRVAYSAKEALELMTHEPVHVIISDQRMPEMTGVEFFNRVKKAYPDVVRLLLTGYADLKAVIAAINEGNVFRYITKPWNAHELDTIVELSFEQHRLKMHNSQLIQDLQENNEKLERSNQQLALINDELDQRVKARTQELNAAIQQLSSLNADLAYQAMTDPLTRLSNRGQFDDRLHYWLQKQQETAILVTLLMIDIDHFKWVNDTYGHPAGDKVIQKLADLLRLNLRSIDEAARYGGEEFAVILPNRAAADGWHIAERLRKQAAIELKTSLPQKTNGQADVITISIGVATALADTDANTLLQTADKALYQAKNNGRNCVIVKDILH